MRHFLLLSLFIFSLTGQSFAQLSKMQFQDAEQVYSEGKFEEAIQFLNEAERSLGKGQPSLLCTCAYFQEREMIKKNPG